MGRDTSQGLQLTTTLVKKNVFLSLSQINLEAILTSAIPSLQKCPHKQIINSPIAILWHRAKNSVQSQYLDSSVGGTRKVSGWLQAITEAGRL